MWELDFVPRLRTLSKQSWSPLVMSRCRELLGRLPPLPILTSVAPPLWLLSPCFANRKSMIFSVAVLNSCSWVRLNWNITFSSCPCYGFESRLCLPHSMSWHVLFLFYNLLTVWVRLKLIFFRCYNVICVFSCEFLD